MLIEVLGLSLLEKSLMAGTLQSMLDRKQPNIKKITIFPFLEEPLQTDCLCT
jgi:hypothetical protein